MSLVDGTTTMKEFLSSNNIFFSDGRVLDYFNVVYFIGDDLKFNRNIQVLFDFIHTDFTRNIALLDNEIDSEEYYIEFSSKYQSYSFDEENNHFVISSNGDNKYGNPYRVIISVPSI